MEKLLVQVVNNDLYIGTWKLSKGFGVEHRALKKLVLKYKNEFQELGFIAPPVQKIETVNEEKVSPIIATSSGINQSKKREKGRPIKEYLLNEAQATYLSTLLTNNEIVRKFKLHLTKAFFTQRKLLARLVNRKANAEWISKRESGKVERRKETDTIKRFVEYAKAQGSQNAGKYYIAISKMQNESLFCVSELEGRFPNVRDLVDGIELEILKMADLVIDKALCEGIKKELPYKEVYALAKERLTNFVEAIGKRPLRAMLLA